DPEPHGADGLAGRPDLQLFQPAFREPPRDRLVGVPGTGDPCPHSQCGGPAVDRPHRQEVAMHQPQTSSSALPHAGGPMANGNGSVVDVDLKALYYGDFKAVRDTRLSIQKNTVTAFIGPSGCGKSTVIRSINRMNDLIRGFRFEGQIRFRGKDIYGKT